MKTSMKYPLNTLALGAALLFSSAVAAAEVSRATFTIGVEDREPIIMVDSINSGSYKSISFFSEINDMTGQTVTHQWIYNDKVMFEKTFEIKADRWRIWTSKTLIPSWTGTWTVKVLDDERATLTSKTFEYL